eukprot:CAMPEP_0182457166 /NCGR_PEP_ID=MMETSP1319-20130603/2808_1 /TAXON_ID=172717 /ORGANISM="Bolidomonas pacifica, Strain RCC208" /LENGTH=116 /DNA_ID=CAMNT_0024655577 /DNA_START=165 /DNA_END=512 /DNA_ORIENTATION=+
MINFDQTLFTALLGTGYVYLMRSVHCRLIKLWSEALKLLYLHSHEEDGVTYYTLKPHHASDGPYELTHMYIHGGGYCVHTATEVMAALRLLQATAGGRRARACLADYPLCPEHTTG